MYAEVLGVILAEPDIEGIGLLFDTDQFQTYPTLDAGSKVRITRLYYNLHLLSLQVRFARFTLVSC